MVPASDRLTRSMLERHTKIVATLGPATDAPGVLDGLLAAGIDCARLNCSHGGPDDLRRRAAAARDAAARAGRPLGLLFDLQGPKLRLSKDTVTRMVTAGDKVVFAGAGAPIQDGDAVIVDFPEFARLVTDRSELVTGEVVTRARTSGPLSPRKGINVTYARPNLPAITEKDAADLALAVELEADFVALSFVRSAADAEDLRARLVERGSLARTIAKIEKIEAYEHLDEILAASDGVMVARGDYGVEAGVARVPLMQKDTIRRATQSGKLVITATQMLESMIHSPEPTRAEATDIANAVIDGTSAVMLSAETGVGEYPVEAVRAMAEIAQAAESAPEIHGRARNDRRGAPGDTPAATVLHAAVQLAEALDATALLVPTATGGGARACAKFRRRRPIIALTHDPRVANQLMLEWGVHPIPVKVAESVEELVEAALEAARDAAHLASGATVVLTAGRRTGTPGATSLVMVREIP
jgi:pyruvate kinase